MNSRTASTAGQWGQQAHHGEESRNRASVPGWAGAWPPAEERRVYYVRSVRRPFEYRDDPDYTVPCAQVTLVSNKRAITEIGRPRFRFSICLILFPTRWPASKQNHNSCGTLGCRIGSGLGRKPDRKRNGRGTSDGYRTPAGVVRYHLAVDVGKHRARARHKRQKARDEWCKYSAVYCPDRLAPHEE